MSITDELREWIDSVAWLDDSVSQAHKNILAIADHIDKQHRKALKNVNELQKLCRDMYAVISDRNSWWDCMRRDTKRFTDRMRELGIDV